MSIQLAKGCHFWLTGSVFPRTRFEESGEDSSSHLRFLEPTTCSAHVAGTRWPLSCVANDQYPIRPLTLRTDLFGIEDSAMVLLAFAASGTVRQSRLVL